MKKAILYSAAALSFGLWTAPALALIDLGTFEGSECGSGGFPNCYANQGGTSGSGSPPPGSPAVYKIGSDGEETFANFATIDGNEFDVMLNTMTNTLSFTYMAGTGDPEVHYIAVKQSDAFRLFYDAAAITGGSFALSDYFPNNPGFSHITFFDTAGGGVIDPRTVVPEPSTWAMMLIGFAGVGLMLRRRRQLSFNGWNRQALPQLA